jgi:hypothetical protein
LLEIDFQIRSDAVAGTTAIDLRSLSLNEGQLVLTVDPVVGADATDGQITIQSVLPAVKSLNAADFEFVVASCELKSMDREISYRTFNYVSEDGYESDDFNERTRRKGFTKKVTVSEPNGLARLPNNEFVPKIRQRLGYSSHVSPPESAAQGRLC